MPLPKRWIPILSFLTAGSMFWLVQRPVPSTAWKFPYHSPEEKQRSGATGEAHEQRSKAPVGAISQTPFLPGTLKAIGESYTKSIVVAKTAGEDVAWVEENFGGDNNIRPVLYVVDDPTAEPHPPKNKGHEVMVYLSYIIDHYNNLSDVNVFMHSHRFAWHNNDLLDNDAVQMISRLSAERVQREGYLNMRCDWDPGCPSWMHPGAVEEDSNKQEETMLARTWLELFPLDGIPEVLAQPCCGQFAVSKNTIRSHPVANYLFYREWLLDTNLSDSISGRIWEYVWQFIFTGKHVVCPKAHVCYCDGFGVCLGGEDEYVSYQTHHKERTVLEAELWGASASEAPQTGKHIEMEGKIRGLLAWENQKRQQAKERGDLAMNRAMDAGRTWKDGDGF